MDLGLKMVLGAWYRDAERGFDIMIQKSTHRHQRGE